MFCYRGGIIKIKRRRNKLIISKQTKNHKALFEFMQSVKIKNKELLNEIADVILANQIKINTETNKTFADVFCSIVKTKDQYFLYSSRMNKENKVHFKIDSSFRMTERYVLEQARPKSKLRIT